MRIEGVSGESGASPARPPERAPAPRLDAKSADAPAPMGARRGGANQEQGPQAARTLGNPPGPRTTFTRLRVDPETDRIVAQIVNEKDEVVRQIPPEELLEIAERIRRYQGLVFDERF